MINEIQRLIEELFQFISHINLYLIPAAGLLFVVGYVWASWKAGVIKAQDKLCETLTAQIDALKKSYNDQKFEMSALVQENQRLQRINMIEQNNLQEQISSLRSYFPSIIERFDNGIKIMNDVILKIDKHESTPTVG
jgi:hypothetical protein